MEYTEKFRPVTQHAVDTVDYGAYLDEMNVKRQAYSNHGQDCVPPYLVAASASEWTAHNGTQSTRWRSRLPYGGIALMEEYVIGNL
jgi:hypothetical protein